MGKTQTEQLVLAKQIADAEIKVEIGALYQHYKSEQKVYKVLGIGVQEATDELEVIYQAQYGERLIFLRPVSVWLEQVEWHGKTVERFSLLK